MPTLEQRSTNPVHLLLLAALLALAAAALLRPAGALAAPTDPVLSFDPGGYDFGLQPVHDGNAQTSFQLRNDGGEGVVVESLSIDGPDSGAFWLGGGDCWSRWLEPGESCSVQVSFGPWEPREFSAQLRATALSQQFAADLTGSGAMALLVPDSNPVDFGAAAVGSAGVTREVEIENVGNWPGAFFIAVISGGAVGSYQLLDETCTNRLLGPGDACVAQVRFQPVSEGAKRATLSLFGDGDGGAQILLTGIGSAPSPPPAPLPSQGAAAVATGSSAAAAAKRKLAKKRKAHRRRNRLRRVENRRRARAAKRRARASQRAALSHRGTIAG